MLKSGGKGRWEELQWGVMDRLPPDLAGIVAELRKGLEELYGKRFRGLLLYGSYARGDQREGSDVDLLVLLDGPVITSREISRIQPVKWPLSLAHDIVLSVMPVSYQAYKKGATAFLRTVRHEAVRAA